MAAADGPIHGTCGRSLFTGTVLTADKTDDSADSGDNQNDDKPGRHSVKVFKVMLWSQK